MVSVRGAEGRRISSGAPPRLDPSQARTPSSTYLRNGTLTRDLVDQLGGQACERLRGRPAVSIDRHQAHEYPQSPPSLLGRLCRLQPLLILRPDDELNRQGAGWGENRGVGPGRHRRYPAYRRWILQRILQDERPPIAKPGQEEPVLKCLRTVKLSQNRR